MSSPYKKFKSINNTWTGYCSMSSLEPHMLYKLMDVVATTHERHGNGQRFVLASADKKLFKCNLPPKYFKKFDDSDFQDMKRDVIASKNPYVVFREVMPDKSFRIDIMEKTDEYDDLYEKKKPAPELENSVEFEDGVLPPPIQVKVEKVNQDDKAEADPSAQADKGKKI